MSQSQRNFFIGISIVLAAMLMIGCLPNKQGEFTCICAPIFSKIKSLLPEKKPKPPDVSPGQTPASPPSAAQGGDANWWKSLPDLKQEESAINGKISGLSDALASKDMDKALNYFQVEEREHYRNLFSKSPGSMSKIATDLRTARISFMGADSTQYSRVAEYSITADGRTFYIQFIKVDGQWMLKAL